MSRQHGVPNEMFAQIMDRAAANGVGEPVVRLVLILLNAMSRGPWHFAIKQDFMDKWMVGAKSNLIGGTLTFKKATP